MTVTAYKQTVVITVQTNDDPTLWGVPQLAKVQSALGKKVGMTRLARFLERAANGMSTAKMAVYVEGVDGTTASGTITISGAGPAAGDTVVLAGVTFTFRTKGTSDPAVITDIDLGSTVTATAANFIAKANLHTTVRGIGPLTAVAGVITWTAEFASQAANTYGTMTQVGSNVALSAAAIASGTESTFVGAAFYGGDGP